MSNGALWSVCCMQLCPLLNIIGVNQRLGITQTERLKEMKRVKERKRQVATERKRAYNEKKAANIIKVVWRVQRKRKMTIEIYESIDDID